MKKRLLAVLLAAALCLSLIPVGAWAQEAALDWSQPTVTIDGVEYQNAGPAPSLPLEFSASGMQDEGDVAYQVGDGFAAGRLSTQEDGSLALYLILSDADLSCPDDTALDVIGFSSITIDLRGENRLVGGNAPAAYMENYNEEEDAMAPCTLRFAGDGSLSAKGTFGGLELHGTFQEGGVAPEQLSLLVEAYDQDDNCSYWVYGNVEAQDIYLVGGQEITFAENALLTVSEAGTISLDSLDVLAGRGSQIVNNGIIISQNPADDGSAVSALGLSGNGFVVVAVSEEQFRGYSNSGEEYVLLNNYLELMVGQPSEDASVYTWAQEGDAWTLTLKDRTLIVGGIAIYAEENASSPVSVHVKSEGSSTVLEQIYAYSEDVPMSLRFTEGAFHVLGCVCCGAFGSRLTVDQGAEMDVTAIFPMIPAAVCVGGSGFPSGDPSFRNGTLEINGKLKAKYPEDMGMFAVSAGNILVGSAGELTVQSPVGVLVGGTEGRFRPEQIGDQDLPLKMGLALEKGAKLRADCQYAALLAMDMTGSALQPEDVFALPEGYLPEGLSLTQIPDQPDEQTEIYYTVTTEEGVEARSLELLPSYAVTAALSEGGTVALDCESAKEGKSVSLSVSPSSGYQLKQVTASWGEGEALELEETPEGYRFIMPAGDVTVTALFQKKSPDVSTPAPVPVPNPGPGPAKPVVTENPDGSTTATETGSDGTVTATTVWEDGQKAVAVTTPEGEKTITVTAAEGEKMADVKIPADPGTGKEFEDVGSEDWFKDSVDSATAYGLFDGVSDTKFNPKGGMTRAMLATVLYNLSGSPEYGAGEGTFEDVEAGRWYEDPVDWAYKVGVTSGTSETAFSPNRDITREQFVAMLYRYAGKLGVDSGKRQALADFPDGNQVEDYAKDAMQWAVAEGLISGRVAGGQNYIAPKGTAIRAEAAAVLTRFVEYLKKE